jgi:hypothetical protein
MSESLKTLFDGLTKLADKADVLTPMLQVVAVILALVVIALMVRRGGH